MKPNKDDPARLGPPAGFELVHRSSEVGFGSSIGPVYLDRANARMAFRVTAEHLDESGWCHSAALATFVDSQVVAVRDSAYEPGGHSPTISLGFDHIAPVPLGSVVEMAVRLVRKTDTMVFTQAILYVDATVIGRSNGIYRHYDGRV